jgi:hypothetical protein
MNPQESEDPKSGNARPKDASTHSEKGTIGNTALAASMIDWSFIGCSASSANGRQSENVLL